MEETVNRLDAIRAVAAHCNCTAEAVEAGDAARHIREAESAQMRLEQLLSEAP
jgi:hypothetical protein